MENNFQTEYSAVRETGIGFYEQKRGLIEVSGGEAVMFLNGLVTNDAKKLAENSWMLAAFPNAQGRLLALVRVLRFGDRFLFDTDAATYEKVLQNLTRFTMAGDFKIRDLTEQFSCICVRGKEMTNFLYEIPDNNEINGENYDEKSGFLIRSFRANGCDVFLPVNQAELYKKDLLERGAIQIMNKETLEVLRIENGEPVYGVDMDETTVVLETGLDEAVSFQKGCYIGQEIIARIHFRGHVAKKLTGLILDETANAGDELKSADGRNAGKITSVTFSPALEKNIALAFVRYDYLAEGTELKVNDSNAAVKNLPFVS